MASKHCLFLCTCAFILMGAGLARGEVNNGCVSSTDCNRNCYIGTCVYVLGGGGGQCQYTPMICYDADPCTDDTCSGGACQFVERICNVDNLFCTLDSCDELGTCQAGLVSPCAPPTPECDENLQVPNTGRCVECLNDTHCAGNPDGERCNTVLGQCVQCLLDEQCIDPNDPYDPTKWCNLDPGICVNCLVDAHCDDNIACFDEACYNNVCMTGYENCPNDFFCDGVEWCDGVIGAGTCQPGDPPCTASGQTCDEINDVCIGCIVNGCPQNPGDCRTYTCNTTTDECDLTLDDTVCDNGVFCDGLETCDSAAGCLDGPDPCSGLTPLCFEASDTCGNCTNDVDCEDNVACTADTCVNNVCQNTDTCDDLDSCNGTESCDMGTGLCVTANDQLYCWPQPYCLESQCVDCVYTEPNAICLTDNDPCTEDRCRPDNTCIYVADTDNDGVLNCCDNCPNTLGTADIQCSSSNPGASNCVCDEPYTPPCGGPAWEGCSCYQLDSDGDGLNDCGKGGDSCPCDKGCPEKGDGCPCYPGESCCSTDPLSLCYCAP